MTSLASTIPPMASDLQVKNQMMADDEAEAGFHFDVYIYILPLIVIFGLSGNVISLVTIFHSRLRRVNANIYLIVLTTADSFFLIGILLVCFKVDWIGYEYCLVNSCSPIERYLAIAHPLAHMKYGHVDRAKIMFYWVPIPFVLQLFQFISLEPSNEERKCALKEANYQIIAQAVDTILCYVIPCCIIVVLNILVALQVRKSQEHFMEDTKKNSSRRTGGSSSSSGTWTRILWVMPLVFVVLNTPFYVIMMIEIVFQIIYQSPPSEATRSDTFMGVYNTAHYMYYMNTAIDVIVYAFSSANFRKTAVIAWKRIICPGYAEKQKGKVLVTDQTSRISYRMTSERSTVRFPNPPSRAGSPKLAATNAVSVPLLSTEVQGQVQESTAI
ncbi:Protein CBG09656 [Caenorhabditis briggsae]|uniref:Protein CBG09656 n=1 Tax=Caenorhabditis briggsae TaxID=6238 RepID=A8X8J4_CAEBR|nr:Protein CBG09656 [Caenorhabditis briggsae]CAP28955.2 Protein CBG09656 [Caenorhabditis briggsae]